MALYRLGSALLLSALKIDNLYSAKQQCHGTKTKPHPVVTPAPLNTDYGNVA